MKTIKLTAVLLALAVASRALHADNLERLPDTWEDRLKAVIQVDVSMLKPDEKKDIEDTRERTSSLLQASLPDESRLAAEFGSLGNLYLAHGLYTSADACYQNAMALNPGHFPWAYYAAYLAQVQGELELALTRFNRALELDPEYKPARYRLARVYLDLNDPGKARALFEPLLDDPGLAAASHEGMGQAYLLTQEHQSAAEYFSKALAIDPEAGQIHYPLAMSLRALGKTEEAREHLKQLNRQEIVIEDRLVDKLHALRDPASRHFVAAMTAKLKKDYPRSVAEFASGLEHEPGNIAARTSYARALYLNGNRAEARKQLEETLSRKPDKTLAVFLLAVLNDEEGKATEAAELYRRVIRLSPGHEGANFYLGNHDLHNRDYANAIRHYQAVTNTNEANTVAQLLKLVAMMGHKAGDRDLLAQARLVSERAPEMLPVKRIEVMILALSDDPKVRDSAQAVSLARQMLEYRRHPVNFELLSLATASAGNFDDARRLLSQAITENSNLGHKKQHDMNAQRMNGYKKLLDAGLLPKLDWNQELSQMMPPPTRALATFSNYPDPKPIKDSR